MPIDPVLLAQLIIAVIELLLKLFGGNAAKVTEYLAASDIPWWNPIRRIRRAAEIRGMILHAWAGPVSQADAANHEAVAVLEASGDYIVSKWPATKSVDIVAHLVKIHRSNPV